MKSSGHETCHHVIYRLTCADYESLLARSGGHCEICETPTSDVPGGNLCIDHDSRYGWSAVRGLVCQRCNAHLRRVDANERWSRPVDDWYFRNAWFVKGAPAVRERKPAITEPRIRHGDIRCHRCAPAR